MSNLKTELEHIKHHIKYPANKTQVLAACNNILESDVTARSEVLVDLFFKHLARGALEPIWRLSTSVLKTARHEGFS